MIPARGDYEAVFATTSNGRSVHHTRRVEAFSDGGSALVVAADGELSYAATMPGFVRVQATAHITGVIPGGGWHADFTDTDTGHQWAEPVVAWVVNSAGNAIPLTVQGDDAVMAEEIGDQGDGWKLVAPGASCRCTDKPTGGQV